jgi:hypothetical protein
MSKMSRNKGNRGQNAVAKLFAKWWGSEFTSTPMSGGFATKRFRSDWNAAGDIVTPDKTFPFCVEVKHQEAWELEQILTSDVCSVWKWWEQCVGETPVGQIPLLVFRKNHKPWFCMLRHSNIPYLVDLALKDTLMSVSSVKHGTLTIFPLTVLLNTEKSKWPPPKSPQ